MSAERRPRSSAGRAASRIAIGRGCASSSRRARGRTGAVRRQRVDKLTTLFIYVILAVMWNALAGYCGLVSIGQQAFFGLGAYAAVRLADCRRRRLSRARARGALLVGALVAAAFGVHAAPAGAANSRSACGWSRSSRICWSISTRWCAAKPARR